MDCERAKSFFRLTPQIGATGAIGTARHVAKRRTLLSLPLIALALLATDRSGQAQTYPSRTITIVIPFPPGLNADVVGRILADKLTKEFGMTVIVENKPGGATVPATSAVLQAPADGHMLFLSSTATNTNPLMGVKAPYDVERDLAPVVLLTITPGVLVVNSALPVKSVAELVQYSKSASKPLQFGSPGNGSFNHLAIEQLKQKTGAVLDHVPFRGLGAAMQGVMRDDVQVTLADIPGALPHVQSGAIRALGQAGRERMPQLKDMPTLIEAGVADYEAAGFLGIWVRNGTPADVIATLNREINAALKTPEMISYADNQGIKIMGGSPADFAAHLKHDKEIWAPVIQKSGAKLDQ